MATKAKLTLAPKKKPLQVKSLTLGGLSKESEKAKKKKVVYKPKVRLTAHIKRK